MFSTENIIVYLSMGFDMISWTAIMKRNSENI